MDAATETLTRYARRAEQAGVPADQIRAVATSAARRAANATSFFEDIRARTGIAIEIISGDEEARLTALGACRDLILPEGTRLVVDLGGGSTELVLLHDRAVLHRASLEIGSVRLTEAFLLDGSHAWAPGVIQPAMIDTLTRHIDAAVARFDFSPRPQTVLGVAGTVTTLAATALGLQTYASSRVHGTSLTREQLGGFVTQLAPLSRQDRRTRVPTSPERADFLVAGAAILARILAACDADTLRVSDRGLRFGLLA